MDRKTTFFGIAKSNVHFSLLSQLRLLQDQLTLYAQSVWAGIEAFAKELIVLHNVFENIIIKNSHVGSFNYFFIRWNQIFMT